MQIKTTKMKTGCRSDLVIIHYRENKGDSESSDLDIQMEGLKISWNLMKLKVLQERPT